MTQQKKDFHVGLVGAGIGGLMAAIAIARAGARVSVLEAAEELGEVRLVLLLRWNTGPGRLSSTTGLLTSTPSRSAQESR